VIALKIKSLHQTIRCPQEITLVQNTRIHAHTFTTDSVEPKKYIIAYTGCGKK